MKALVIAPTWMGLSTDIIDGLINIGYEVDFIRDKISRFDPLNVRTSFHVPSSIMEKRKIHYWHKTLESNHYKKNYDLLLVIDGQYFHSCVISILKKRNPQLFTVNYLYDTVKGVHRFDLNFRFFDRVASFDRSESREYNILFLPIYWKKNKNKLNLNYKVFGFGTFSKYRYLIYKELDRILTSHKISSRIELYTPVIKRRRLFQFIYLCKEVLGIITDISLSEYDDKMVVNEIIDTNTFQDIIANVDVVLDTSPVHQDGMTARFMWALGLGKKIITTNCSIRDYAFYSPKQILIIPAKPCELCAEEIVSFIYSSGEPDTTKRRLIEDLEINNWLKKLVSK